MASLVARPLPLSSGEISFRRSEAQKQRRLRRLQQVRKQEALRAAAIVNTRKARISNAKARIVGEQYREWKEKERQQRQNLKQRVNRSLENLGAAHKQAAQSSHQDLQSARKQLKRWHKNNQVNLSRYVSAVKDERKNLNAYRTRVQQSENRRSTHAEESTKQRQKARAYAEAIKTAQLQNHGEEMRDMEVNYDDEDVLRTLEQDVLQAGATKSDYGRTKFHLAVTRHNQPVSKISPKEMRRLEKNAASTRVRVTAHRRRVIAKDAETVRRSAREAAIDEQVRMTERKKIREEERQLREEKAERRSRAALGRLRADMELAELRRAMARGRTDAWRATPDVPEPQRRTDDVALQNRFERMFMNADENSYDESLSDIVADDSSALHNDSSALEFAIIDVIANDGQGADDGAAGTVPVDTIDEEKEEVQGKGEASTAATTLKGGSGNEAPSTPRSRKDERTSENGPSDPGAKATATASAGEDNATTATTSSTQAPKLDSPRSSLREISEGLSQLANELSSASMESPTRATFERLPGEFFPSPPRRSRPGAQAMDLDFTDVDTAAATAAAAAAAFHHHLQSKPSED
eukprot:g4243.t1